MIAASALVVGVTGAGIGYAVAGQGATAATTSPAPVTAGSTKLAPLPGAGAISGPGSAQVARAVRQTLNAIANEIGQSVTTIRGELASGKSIDQIAGAKAPAIESRIVAQFTKLAGRAVSAGKITTTQETSILAMAKTKVAALMAEPGTQLLKDARGDFQFLKGNGARHLPPPAAAAPTPAA
ncbi:MAG TPA: hypothetical protein VG520_08250 [Candidatus Dormibacteraeota bacterium]|nr:hypothetical protein [Candidatus Dormibacteraeota bacterium]